MDSSNINAVGIIPSRYNSSRFPGKPLADIKGKSMVQRVYEQATKAKLLSQVFIATDDERIFEHAKTFTNNVLMTSDKHLNGTERVAEAVDILKSMNINVNLVVNIQGDEPYIAPEQIDGVLSVLIENDNADIATLVKKIAYDDACNYNKVKAVLGGNNKALYFSRQLIPFSKQPEKIEYLKHVGLYAYRANILKEIVKLQPTPLELSESLEQLRWLENNYNIYAEFTEYETLSVDAPEDVAKIIS